jgi:dienelactone hydrolase
MRPEHAAEMIPRHFNASLRAFGRRSSGPMQVSELIDINKNPTTVRPEDDRRCALSEAFQCLGDVPGDARDRRRRVGHARLRIRPPHRSRAACNVALSAMLALLTASTSAALADASLQTSANGGDAIATSPGTVAASAIGGIPYDASEPVTPVVTPMFDAAHPPTGPRTYHVRFRGAVGDTVPGLLTLPANATVAAPVPCIVLVHGLGQSKSDILMLLLGGALVRHGYACLAVDVAGHGERPQIDSKPVDRLDLREFHMLAATTAVDLRRTVDFLQTQPEIDSGRVGLLGVSLGGILGGLAAGYEPRYRSVALWSAGGDWGRLLTTSEHPFAVSFRKRVVLPAGVAAGAAIESALADVDPDAVIGRLAPARALLLLEGTSDTVVPPPCTDALFAAAGQPKTCVRYPGGHVPDPSGMTIRSLQFFDATLGGAH